METSLRTSCVGLASPRSVFCPRGEDLHCYTLGTMNERCVFHTVRVRSRGLIAFACVHTSSEKTGSVVFFRTPGFNWSTTEQLAASRSGAASRLSLSELTSERGQAFPSYCTTFPRDDNTFFLSFFLYPGTDSGSGSTLGFILGRWSQSGEECLLKQSNSHPVPPYVPSLPGSTPCGFILAQIAILG